MNLRDFQREGSWKAPVREPWKFSDKSLVSVSNGAILLLRDLRKTDPYQEATPEVRNTFLPYIEQGIPADTKIIKTPLLRAWATKGGCSGGWGRKRFPMFPGFALGELFNRNYLALALKLASEPVWNVALIRYETGAALMLGGLKWKIFVMCIVKTVLEEAEFKRKKPPVLKFA